MADEKTSVDSIRLYLTGASSDGGAQTDADASLGNYRSSTLATFLSQSVTSAIANVTIDFVSGNNGTGSGSLAAATTDSLTWTAPSGSAGTAVTIANGETKILQDGTTPSKYVCVTRTSADNLTGTATVTLSYEANNVIGFDDVSSAEATSGDDEYRAYMIKNESSNSVLNIYAYIKQTPGTSNQTSDSAQLGASGAGTITTTGSFAAWPDQGFAHIQDSGGSTTELVYYSARTATSLTVPSAGRGVLGTSAVAGSADDEVYCVPGIRIAKEAPTSDALTDKTGAGEGSAPSVSWNYGLDTTNGVSIGTLATTALYGVWIHREIVAGHTNDVDVINCFTLSYDAA